MPACRAEKWQARQLNFDTNYPAELSQRHPNGCLPASSHHLCILSRMLPVTFVGPCLCPHHNCRCLSVCWCDIVLLRDSQYTDINKDGQHVSTSSCKDKGKISCVRALPPMSFGARVCVAVSSPTHTTARLNRDDSPGFIALSS